MPTQLDIPPELLSKIDKYLAERDLVCASEVSRDWRTALMSFVWTFITHYKWRCPQFRFLGELVRQEKLHELCALLYRVVEVEWGDDDNSGLTYPELAAILKGMPNLQWLSLRAIAPAKKVLLNLLKDPGELLKVNHVQLDLVGFEAEAEGEEQGDIKEGETEEGDEEDEEEGEFAGSGKRGASPTA